MEIRDTQRGFEALVHEIYPPKEGEVGRVVQRSSMIGNYSDSFDRPGSSYLWVGDQHHLNREEIQTLVEHLRHWLKTGYLDLERGEELEQPASSMKMSRMVAALLVGKTVQTNQGVTGEVSAHLADEVLIVEGPIAVWTNVENITVVQPD